MKIDYARVFRLMLISVFMSFMISFFIFGVQGFIDLKTVARVFCVVISVVQLIYWGFRFVHTILFP